MNDLFMCRVPVDCVRNALLESSTSPWHQCLSFLNGLAEATQALFISYPLPVIENLCEKKIFKRARERAQQVKALATEAWGSDSPQLM